MEECAHLRWYIYFLFDHRQANIIAYMGLEFSKGADFEKKLVSYIIPYYRKGIPSLFSEIKHLYSDAEKVAAIEKIILAN